MPDPSKKSGQRLVGDVDYESALQVASRITPVPGGVGPMTISSVLQNVLLSAKKFYNESLLRKVEPIPLKIQTSVPSDIEISRSAIPKNIRHLAHEVSILDHELELYGPYKAKVSLDVLKRLGHRRDGHYVYVSGINPTPLGEGKSTTTIGLVQALTAHLGKLSFACVRQPSQGPTFGIKGGAAGGGYSQVTLILWKLSSRSFLWKSSIYILQVTSMQSRLQTTFSVCASELSSNFPAAAIDTRMFHEATQKDKALYNRLVPVTKGKREFAPSMLRRLKKLGIDKTDPNELTDDEIRRFARLDIDPNSITWLAILFGADAGIVFWMSMTAFYERLLLGRVLRRKVS